MKRLIIIFCFISNSLFALNDSSINNISLRGNYNSGNYNFYAIGYSSDINYNKNNNHLELLSTFLYTQSATFDSNNKTHYILKENEKYSILSYSNTKDKIKFIALSEIETSFLRKINLRYDLGAGIGYKFISNKEIYFDASEVLLPEYTQFTIGNITSLKYSTRIKFLYHKSLIDINSITLFQPCIYNNRTENLNKDINLRSITTFEVKMNKSLSIGISDEIILNKYVAYLYNMIKPYDNTLTFLIKYKF